MVRALSLLAYICLSALTLASAQGVPPPAAKKIARYVYVQHDPLVSIFTINTKGQWRTNGFDAMDQDAPFNSSAIDPQGRFFFGMTNVSCNKISVFSIASGTGRLTPVAGSPFSTFGLTNVTGGAIVVTPNGKFVYSLSNDIGLCGTNNITGFAVNSSTGALTPVPNTPTSDGELPLHAVIDSKSKFLFVADNGTDAVSVFSIDPSTGALTAVTGSPFPGAGAFPTGLTMDPLGRALYVSDGFVNDLIWAFNIDPSTHIPHLVPSSPFLAQLNMPSVTTDPKGNFVYAPSVGSYETGMYKVIHTTGSLKFVSNLRGLLASKSVLMSTGAAAVKYVPKFAYVANSGSNSISEYSFNSDGTLLELTGSPLTDSNGPTAVSATPSGSFVYTLDANHKVSGYSVGGSGTLTKIPTSPFSPFTAPAALTTDPSSRYLFVLDNLTAPNPGGLWMEKIGSDGSLTFASFANNSSNTATAIAMTPGTDYLFVWNSAEKVIANFQAGYRFGSPGLSSVRATAPTGNGPSPVAVDPTSNFVYVTNSTDGNVSAYKISDGTDGHVHGTPVPVAKSPFAAGTSPSAVVAEPSGKYLYVANSGNSNIFAYKIKATTGALTKIAGSFPTGSAPDSLTVSNDGKFLYASNKSSGSVSVFTINSNGTLTAGTAATTGTSPSSIAATGTTN
jgi:6-phosphogluconolactonase (cycloisomerase 2 family)